MSRKALIPVLLLTTLMTGLQVAGADSTKGNFDFFFSSRSFLAPVFGPNTTATYRLLGRQSLRGQGNLALWLADGFPSFTTDFGAELSELPLAGGLARLNAGDFFFKPLRPPNTGVATRETYPLRGAGFRLQTNRTQWNVFGGQARRFREFPGREMEAPTLVGASVLRRKGLRHYGLSVTAVQNPTMVDSPDGAGPGAAVVFGGEFVQQFSPWSSAFVQVLGNSGGGFGGRGGARFRTQTAEFRAGVYAFDRRFPFVDPLYRPGERGLEFYGQYRVSEFSSLSGHFDWALDQGADRRSDMRGEIAFSWLMGAGGPLIHASFSRNETVYDPSSAAQINAHFDRFALIATKSTSSTFHALSAEHLISSRSDQPDRSQLTYDFRRLLNGRSYLDGSVLVQRQPGVLGVTSESALERPLRGLWSYRVAGGMAWVGRSGKSTGEGAARFGVSRRLFANGWSVRLEYLQPFSIGLPRNGLARSGFSVDFGYRLGWKDFETLRSRLAPAVGMGELGEIEGMVLLPPANLGSIAVLLNGQPVAATSQDGRFRISRAAAGEATVSLDLRNVDPRYGAVGGASRQVLVRPGETSFVEFRLAAFSYFQGAVVMCHGEARRPVAGAELTLQGEGYSQTTRTSRVGGFQFDEIPPGPKELILSPGTLPEGAATAPLRWSVDLTEDLSGYLVQVNCPAER